ncbi:hypothetical protein U1Q18_003810 [Sarracenia purpurea var. burkii]
MADYAWVYAWIEDVPKGIDDDLSSWELVNRPEDEGHDDEIQDVSYDEDEDLDSLQSISSDLSTRSSPRDFVDHANDPKVHVQDLKGVLIDEQFGFDHYNDQNEGQEKDVYDDDDNADDDYDGGGAYENDLDDDLVPKSVSDRFGRQRLKKLGKRAYPKMNSSRKLPYYYYNRPDCVHGKHALGLNRNII